MAKEHIVQPGDHLLRLAATEGFRDFHTIWDDPANAALKKLRFNPNVLDPKDRVVVPDKQPLSTTRPAGTQNQFPLKRSPSILTVKLQSAGFQPRAGRTTQVIVTIDEGGTPRKITQDGVQTGTDGGRTVRSGNPLIDAELRLLAGAGPSDVAERFPLLVAHLPPLSVRRGQQARLNNMGYLAGFQETDIEQFRWAVEEFQVDHRKQFPRMKRLGLLADNSVDKETLIALGTVHGDLLPGQEGSL